MWSAQSDKARVCYSMAEWEWTVEVQTWQTYRRPDGQLGSYQVVDDDGPDRETWYVGRIKMLPWEIWYDV